MFFKILERKKGKKSKKSKRCSQKTFTKDVHKTGKKRSLKRKRSHPKSEKNLFSLFNLQTNSSRKEKKRRGRSCTDPWQDQSQDIHRSDEEKDISRPC